MTRRGTRVQPFDEVSTTMPKSKTPQPGDIDRVIRANLDRLTKPGVLTVRPGYEITNGQLTGRQAIVATVHTKKPTLPKNDLLPDSIGALPVDVREATAHQRLRARDPASAELVQTYGRPEDKDPTWPYEREVPGGRLLDNAKSNTQKALQTHLAHQPATSEALRSQAAKQHVDYQPPRGVVLGPVDTQATIIAHVSPDAGLATLQTFLRDTQKSLVVGMYDFTSGVILRTFEDVLVGKKTLQMVLDNPAPNPTRDQTDTQTVEQLDKALGSRAEIVRALDRPDVFASAWMFPYAYHIKVMVRDGNAVWLSSGNLNNSNQPDLSAPPKTEDRDWHVIIEEPKLAGLFLAFLNQDYASAKQYQAKAAASLPLERAVADAEAKLADDANPPSPATGTRPPKSRYVPAKTFSNVDVTITPLFTPDKLPGSASAGQYLTNILKLVNSAEKTLYIQLQYIEASSGSGNYDTLLRAIAGRVAAGVDVRLIESAEYGTKWVEKMKAAGVDLTANIRLQSNVHNKGFVVDSTQVVVSSQNFSPAGVEENRDAGVILDSPEIAGYFEKIFLADWEDRTKPSVAPAAATAEKRGKSAAKGKPAKQSARRTPASKVAAKRGSTRRKKAG